MDVKAARSRISGDSHIDPSERSGEQMSEEKIAGVAYALQPMLSVPNGARADPLRRQW
jgi:hypothetical protein